MFTSVFSTQMCEHLFFFVRFFLADGYRGLRVKLLVPRLDYTKIREAKTNLFFHLSFHVKVRKNHF